jgi:hypothetical protein
MPGVSPAEDLTNGDVGSTGVYDVVRKKIVDISLPEVLAVGDSGLLLCRPALTPRLKAGGTELWCVEIRDGEKWTGRHPLISLGNPVALPAAFLPGNTQLLVGTMKGLEVFDLTAEVRDEHTLANMTGIESLALNPADPDRLLVVSQHRSEDVATLPAQGSSDVSLIDVSSGRYRRRIGRCAGAATWFTVPGK